MSATAQAACGELVLSSYDIAADQLRFEIDGKLFKFRTSQTLFPLIKINGKWFAERTQILKHAESRMPFIPDWAERELAPKAIYTERPERDAEVPSVELDLLRAFFDAWQSLHAIPNDKFHRRKKEDAAQVLTNAAQSVIRFRNPVAPNGS